ncbi:MAG: hypothetical protein E7185_03295 [Erysipelotrichaceae bacterium]|nr:hypothetical protein [Erysipelotrichaceae bacterium]
METVIADEYRREELFHALKSRLGLQIISLSALLETKTDKSDVRLLFECARRIRNHAGDLKYYLSMLAFPAFYQELLQFAQQLALFGITAEDLPERDGSERELKVILGWILDEDLKEKHLHDRYEETCRRIAGMENLKIVLGFEQDIFRYRLLKDLEKNGAEVMKQHSDNPVQKRRHALSVRQEIEAVAQDICRQKKPCLVVLCSPDVQMPLVKQVFCRYNIPVSFVNEDCFSRVPDAFYSAVDFMLHKDAAHLLNVFVSGLLEPCEGRLLSYLRQTMTKTEAPGISRRYEEILQRIHSREEDSVAKNRELETFRRLDKEAAEYFLRIDAPLQKMLQVQDAKEILQTAYDILSSSPLMENDTDFAAGMKIRTLLSDLLPDIRSNEDAMFIAEVILSLHVSGTSSLSEFCTVTDLRHPLASRQITYVLGCCGRDYPGFKAMNGLFDEDYVRQIPAFPSLAEREEAWRLQMQWLRESAKETVYWSYATNDYEGRQLVPAFELDSLEAGEDLRWPLQTASQSRFRHHLLAEDTARALFTREDESGPYVRGSVSSIEAWFNCPYRFFIASGLYVRKEQIPAVDAAHIGTIQHAVMENGMLAAGENYAEWLTDENIDALISPYFEALEVIEPHQADLIHLSKQRMLRSLRRSVDFLKEYEACTTFRPYRPEHHFDNIPVSGHVRLNGTIDRINTDEANHLLEIIDYKSSAKNLTVSKVQEGLQLQMLSYMMTALQLMKEYEAGGAYYFSMKEESISAGKDLPAASVERRKFTLRETDFSDEEALFSDLVRDSRKLQGWALTDRTDAIDRDGNHVAGLKTVYDMTAVEDCLHVLYDYFYEKLLSGEESSTVPSGISLAPIEGACQFCDYAAICRFHGDSRNPVKIYENDLKKAKEAES